MALFKGYVVTMHAVGAAAKEDIEKRVWWWQQPWMRKYQPKVTTLGQKMLVYWYNSSA